MSCRGCGGDGDGGAFGVGAATGDGAHGGVVGEDGEGVGGYGGAGDGDVVENHPVLVGAAVMAESYVDGLADKAAEVNGALGVAVGGEGCLE